MLNVFTLANGRLFQEEIESLEELARFKPIWVDLESPTPEERRWVKQHFGLSIPEDAMDEDIEESARFYEEDNGCLLYTSPSPRDRQKSRMPSSA